MLDCVVYKSTCELLAGWNQCSIVMSALNNGHLKAMGRTGWWHTPDDEQPQWCWFNGHGCDESKDKTEGDIDMWDGRREKTHW